MGVELNGETWVGSPSSFLAAARAADATMIVTRRGDWSAARYQQLIAAARTQKMTLVQTSVVPQSVRGWKAFAALCARRPVVERCALLAPSAARAATLAVPRRARVIVIQVTTPASLVRVAKVKHPRSGIVAVLPAPSGAALAKWQAAVQSARAGGIALAVAAPASGGQAVLTRFQALVEGATKTIADADDTPPTLLGDFGEVGADATHLTLHWTAAQDESGVGSYSILSSGVEITTTTDTTVTLSGLTCGTTYHLGLVATDTVGNRSDPEPLDVTTSACSTAGGGGGGGGGGGASPAPHDSVAPSVPSGVTAASVTTTGASLSWNASTDNVAVAGYGIYRNGTLVGSTAARTFNLAGLSCGTTYSVSVDAFDTTGNRSAKTTVFVSTRACVDTAAPAAPTGLTAGVKTQTSIALSWTASTDNVGVTGYGLYRNGTRISTASATNGSLTSLTCGTSYTLAVDAVDAAGNRSAKATITASTATCSQSTDTQAPSAPTGLGVTSATTSSIALAWTASTDNVGVAGYDIYNGSATAGTVGGLAFTVSGLNCGSAYTLAVDAVDTAGNNSAKTTVTTSTAACPAPPPPPPPPPAGPPPAGNANLWVDTTGGSCSRQATPAAYADATACSSFQAAYSAAQCGDTVGVRGGSYSTQSISSGAKSCASTTQVTITSAPGASCTDNTAVSLPAVSISVAYLKLQCMNANPSGTTSCVDVSGSSHASVVWISLDQMAIHCGFFDSDHLRVTNTTFGPDNTCETNSEDLIDFRANATSINDVVFDHVTFETVTAPPDFGCGVGKHVDSMQGYGISNLVISNSIFYGCPGQCIIFRPYAGGTPGPITIENTIFNQAQDPGQAIDIGSSTPSDGDNCVGPILIQNNTFVNDAALHGGCWNNPSVIVRDNIMSNSTCNFGGSGDVYSFNVFYSGAACGSNSKVCIPTFVFNTTSKTSPGDFHLAPTDTCAKGAADQANHAATDMDGQSRPQGPAVDAGADEIP